MIYLPNHDSLGLAIDSQALSKLKLDAKSDPQQALPAVAKQFESVLLGMMVKSMREALPQEDSLTGESSRLFTGMLDQQLVQKLADKGIGLADVMMKQLARAESHQAHTVNSLPAFDQPPASPRPVSRGHSSSDPHSQVTTPPQAFVKRVWDDAQSAARLTGIPAKFMIGQAALESGWGKREIRHADGSPSFNLFGIKAGKTWSGATVDVLTTEYANGEPRKVVQKFRSYASYAEAFGDYGKLLTKNPRYAKVLEHGVDATSFARGLQRAGYATDPRYADKLTGVINHSALNEMSA